ncbi:helix-turn-helix transcriptional regulator [Paractinoplanes brasiliensis]|uniref:Putative DNA-binding transcriptional regulator YafY n=1 Tax=Paractinoplanes brasiliensis TaxID=52695 RepID=A0A4R6J9G9_9ACTN|nr:YafY family protein [Actinoplanes brasiliensis]TDO32293.1 putative DNA-binding transcriptional regulator YafY [Actinoplanes brasiliensis]
MGTTERVLALLGLLQQRRLWTGPELASRLGVTTRTVRRDVERLRVLGYPVHAGQGVGGGYQLGPGQDLPPLLLDDEEAIATAVALLAGAESGDAALRALTKLDRVLPTRLRHEVRALAGSVSSFGGGRPAVDSEALTTLARACRDEVLVQFVYARPSGTGRVTDGPSGAVADGSSGAVAGGSLREVEPYRLVASDRRWYLLAFDVGRNDWRTFRVDRMSEISEKSWHFKRREAVPEAAAFVQESVSSRVYKYQARFLVRAPMATIRALIPASAAVVRERTATTCEVISGAGNLDFILMHMTLLGHDFEVLDPPDLRERCAVLADRLRRAAEHQ